MGEAEDTVVVDAAAWDALREALAREPRVIPGFAELMQRASVFAD